MLPLYYEPGMYVSFRCQFTDDLKTARNLATQVYTQYIEETKTSRC